jgi:hypothetical protein
MTVLPLPTADASPLTLPGAAREGVSNLILVFHKSCRMVLLASRKWTESF